MFLRFSLSIFLNEVKEKIKTKIIFYFIACTSGLSFLSLSRYFSLTDQKLRHNHKIFNYCTFLNKNQCISYKLLNNKMLSKVDTNICLQKFLETIYLFITIFNFYFCFFFVLIFTIFSFVHGNINALFFSPSTIQNRKNETWEGKNQHIWKLLGSNSNKGLSDSIKRFDFSLKNTGMISFLLITFYYLLCTINS